MATFVPVLAIAAVVWALAYFGVPLVAWTLIVGAALVAGSYFCPPSVTTLILLWSVFLIAAAVLNLPFLRRVLISNAVFAAFRRIMPSMSTTEREALDA